MHHPVSIAGNGFGDCYDRVAHMEQSVALRENGMSQNGVNMVLLVLETMKFYLRTNFGE